MKEYKINKEDMSKYLISGMSSFDIEKETGVNKTTIIYYIKQYGLEDLNKYKKPKYVEDFFSKIDSKEKAYMLGFLLGDGHMSKENKISCDIALADKEVLYKFSDWTGAKVQEFEKIERSKRMFPKARMNIGNKEIVKNLNMLFGGRLKEERHIPIISKKYEHYLVQGFFDAEGCITFGHRKDRVKIWCKVSFTSQLKMLTGIQNILVKNGISSRIYPKKDSKCYVLEISKPKTVLQFLDYLYSDNNFVVLHRKYNKSIALRRELGENGEGAKMQ